MVAVIYLSILIRNIMNTINDLIVQPNDPLQVLKKRSSDGGQAKKLLTSAFGWSSGSSWYMFASSDSILNIYNYFI